MELGDRWLPREPTLAPNPGRQDVSADAMQRCGYLPYRPCHKVFTLQPAHQVLRRPLQPPLLQSHGSPDEDHEEGQEANKRTWIKPEASHGHTTCERSTKRGSLNAWRSRPSTLSEEGNEGRHEGQGHEGQADEGRPDG